jgi:hypothetical protein
MNSPINARDFGLVGNGLADDTNAFRDMHGESQLQRRAIYLPYGDYLITDDLSLSCDNPVVVYGDSQQASKLLFDGCPGLLYNFYQHGIQQPVGLVMRHLGLSARGGCGTGLSIGYGNPAVTNDHYRGAVNLRDVAIESSDQGHWIGGVKLDGVWNATLDNVYASGDPAGGVWNNMAGSGLSLEGLCVNLKATNCRFNFWATGVYAHGITHNHEGLFFSNCSMVAVKRGAWVKGNPEYMAGNTLAPRIHTFNWMGGMIENRFTGVTGGLAAFHLENVWSSSIVGCQMITDTLATLEASYGVIAQNCQRVMVSACEINAYQYAIATTGESGGHCFRDNAIANCSSGVVLSPEDTTSVC